MDPANSLTVADEIHRWITPLMIAACGYLVRSWMGDLKAGFTVMASKVDIAMSKIADHETKHAVTESRLNRLEGEMASLHGRVSRLITDRFFRDPDEKG